MKIWHNYSSSFAKRQKISTSLLRMGKIATHSGAFHADEALAVYLLKLLPRYKEYQVIRSRDSKVLDECNIVVDVGGIYNVDKNRFDHHQREFQDTFSENHSTRLSSAGLVYKHFGKEIISSILGIDLKHAWTSMIYLKIYDEFIEPLDANDNGIEPYPQDIKPRFKTKGVTLMSMVGSLNPNWNEDDSDIIRYQQFLKASKLMGDAFLEKVNGYGKSWMPARKFVEEAVDDALKGNNDPFNGKVLIFSMSLPWKEHLFDIEKEKNIPGQFLYIIYPESKAINAAWRIQCVPEQEQSFVNRKSLPQEWRGLRDDILSAKTGIPGCIFTHAGGFIGGAKTKDSVFAMAKSALEN